MQLLDATNVESYLRDARRVSAGERVCVQELAGGVSNIVLRVEFPDSGRAPFVLKQAREQLRVAQPWFCSPERIWREVEVLEVCHRLLEVQPYPGYSLQTPAVLFDDREQYLFAMSAAPEGAQTWKSRLLAGDTDPRVAHSAGVLLGRIHGQSWGDPALAKQFADRQFFHDLRVDPYYYEIARRHPQLAPAVDDLVAELYAHRVCLVHGDFSPKNILTWPTGVFLIDHEVGHFGDPAFDVSFVLTHLFLKALHRPEQAHDYLLNADLLAYNYAATLQKCQVPGYDYQQLLQRTVRHLRACLLARADGKSPVEYLSDSTRAEVRRIALRWFDEPPRTMKDAIADMRTITARAPSS